RRRAHVVAPHAESDRRARGVRLAGAVARVGRGGVARAETETAFRARRTDHAGWSDTTACARLVPRVATEHVHRQVDAGDVARGAVRGRVTVRTRLKAESGTGLPCWRGVRLHRETTSGIEWPGRKGGGSGGAGGSPPHRPRAESAVSDTEGFGRKRRPRRDPRVETEGRHRSVRG